MATTAQMQGALIFLKTAGIRGLPYDRVCASLTAGPHTEAWLQGSEVVFDLAHAPEIAKAPRILIQQGVSYLSG